VLDVGTDARGQAGEAAVQPGLEGRDPVVAEQADRGQDLRGALDAVAVGAKRRNISE
jgi:hypothetical protein